MCKTIITTNFKETQALGRKFAANLKGGEVIALYGDLGSGKTTFMQGLAEGLGITRNIISPTFIIMRTYQLIRHSGDERSEDSRIKEGSWTSQDDSLKIRNLYHLDLYRIENEEQAIDLGLQELMHDPENIVAIEWPDKIENILPDERVNIYFTYLRDDKREILIG